METSNGRVSTLTATPDNNIVEIPLSNPNYDSVIQTNQSTTFKMTMANDNLTPLKFLIACGCQKNVNEEFDQIVVINWLRPNTLTISTRLNHTV
jgi:hypothetical protein